MGIKGNLPLFSLPNFTKNNQHKTNDNVNKNNASNNCVGTFFPKEIVSPLVKSA